MLYTGHDLIITLDDYAHGNTYVEFFVVFSPSQMHNIPSIVIGQDMGQNVEFREVFDVTVARAVAEMRILGIYNFIDCLEMFQLVQ